MSFVKTIPPDDAGDELRALYDQDLTTSGYVPNYTLCLSQRPKAIAAWRTLSRAIRSTIPLRRYELITFAAALALRCRY